ncbi:MAG: hypothetical protein AAFN70_15210, partial [Planctomycetota bacterium]
GFQKEESDSDFETPFGGAGPGDADPFGVDSPAPATANIASTSGARISSTREDDKSMPSAAPEPASGSEYAAIAEFFDESGIANRPPTTSGDGPNIDLSRKAIDARRVELRWTLEGVRGLPIALAMDQRLKTNQSFLTARSLGVRPKIRLRLANKQRYQWLMMSVCGALLLALACIAWFAKSWSPSIWCIVWMIAGGLLLPAFAGTGFASLNLAISAEIPQSLGDALLMAGVLGIPLVLLVGLLGWLHRKWDHVRNTHANVNSDTDQTSGDAGTDTLAVNAHASSLARGSAGVVILCFAMVGSAGTCHAQDETGSGANRVVVGEDGTLTVTPTGPAKKTIQEGTVVVPYLTIRGNEPVPSDTVVLPMATYQRLRKIAESAVGTASEKIADNIKNDYVLSNAVYEGTLSGKSFLQLSADITIDVLRQEPVQILLPVSDLVLQSATL